MFGGPSMKKASGLFVVLVTVFLAVFAGQFKNSVVAARSVKSRELSANEESLKQQIAAKESEGLDGLKSGDVEIFANLTAEEAIFVDAAGLATKAEVMKNVSGFTLTDYSMEDVRFIPL